MDQDGDGAGLVEVDLRTFAPGLLGAGRSFDHRVDRLQVAGVRQQADGYLFAVRRDVGAVGFRVVFHVSGDVAIEPGTLLALFELDQDGFVWAVDHVSDHAEPASVSHAHGHLPGAFLR